MIGHAEPDHRPPMIEIHVQPKLVPTRHGRIPSQAEDRRRGSTVCVYDLRDRHDVMIQHDVAGFLVETSRGLVHGNARHAISVAACGPRIAETLDPQSDAFTPPPADDGDTRQAGEPGTRYPSGGRRLARA